MRRGGRLLLLLGLLIAAGAAAFLFFVLQGQGLGDTSPSPAELAPTPIPEVEVVVARIDIPRGAVISDTETYLTTEPIGLDAYDADPENYLRSVDEARGLLAVNSIARGTTVRQADLAEPGLAQSMPTAVGDEPRPKALPLLVNNLTGVADLIQQGDSVDVLISFQIDVTGVGAGIGTDPTSQLPVIVPVERQFEAQRTTKTIVQNVEVLRIVRQQTQAVAVEGEPTAEPEVISGEGEGPSEDPAVTTEEGAEAPPPANWILVLAVTDQEAELIKFAQEEGQRLVLVLRGSGDQDEEETTGVTLDLLINQYGVPLPDPFSGNQSQPLTPVPTTAPTP
jgi:pilus assembly protein CpaB